MAEKTRQIMDDGKKAPIFGVRHLQCFLIFWGVSFAYAMRVNLSLAIVAITDKNSANPNFPEYVWSEKMKSVLLSSFFWGYVITQIPGGYLARRFGAKQAIFVGILISSILAILTPLCIRIGNWPALIVLRVLQGMFQGILYPTTHTLLSKWSPAEERGTLGTYCYSGSPFGTVVMLATSGLIASSSLGWPGIYYISGGLGALWSFVWYIWGSSSPNDCKRISMAEKKLIETSLASNGYGNGNGNDDDAGLCKNIRKDHLKPPWIKFFMSSSFLSLILAHCAYNWVFWTILSEIPSYMKNILNFNIKSNALLTSLPYLAMLLLGFAFSGLAALIEKYKCLTITQSRKFFNTISTWIPAAALIFLGYVPADQSHIAVGLLILSVGSSAAMHMGFQINHIDLSPNFAGILLGITNTFSNTMSILAPLTVGVIVTDVRNIYQWRIVFLTAAGISFFGNLIFIIFGSAEVQSFNEPTNHSVDHELKPINRKTQKISNEILSFQ